MPKDTFSPAHKKKLGELLLIEGYLSQQQLEAALQYQLNAKNYEPLGQICVDLEFLTPQELQSFINRHQRDIHLGELLLNLGLLTPEQLETALKLQQQGDQYDQHKKLGKILIEKSIVSEEELVAALSMQLDIPKIIPSLQLLDTDLLKEMDPIFLEHNECIPVSRDGNRVVVLMSDPLNDHLIDSLSHKLQAEIQPAIAPAREILQAIMMFYFPGKLSQAQLHLMESQTTKALEIGEFKLDSSHSRRDNIIDMVNFIISGAVIDEASDIHIEPQEHFLRIRYRIDGILHHKTDLPLATAAALVSRIKILCELDIAEKRRHQDGRINARVMGKDVDLRVSTYVSLWGENIVMRLLYKNTHLLDIRKIGLSPLNFGRFKEILDCPTGVVIVTGPTGSGKTTTLYASLNYLNRGNMAIMTVEDPIEFTMEGIIQGQLDTKLDVSYMDFIKSMMRQDPDVLMIGEIRDVTAAEATIQAALTGHKVLTTFHTDDTTGALLRMMDMGIETFLISSTVLSVLSQRLVRQLCPECRQPFKPKAAEIEKSFHILPEGLEEISFYQAKGCEKCHFNGYKGRIGIHELLLVNDAIRDTILARRTSSEIRAVARREANLVSILEDGFYKATLGITSLEEVLRVAFFNESDQAAPRTAREVITLCEGKEPQTKSPNWLQGHNQAIATQSREVLRNSEEIFTNGTTPLVLQGEHYRTRLDLESPLAETDKIAKLFQKFTELQAKLGTELSEDELLDFQNFVQHLHMRYRKRGARYLELILHIKDHAVQMAVETVVPVPQKQQQVLNLSQMLSKTLKMPKASQ